MPMTVKAILSHKGNDVVTIKPTATLCDAAEILNEHGIGAVVITGAERRVLGILSERDIVRTLAHKARVAGGYQLSDEPVEKVMTRQVVTCKESDTVLELMERMTFGKFRHLPVMEDGRLVGIVSIGDVVKHRLAQMALESNALREEPNLKSSRERLATCCQPRGIREGPTFLPVSIGRTESRPSCWLGWGVV